MAWLEYTINMYSNMKEIRKYLQLFWVIQQDKNRKLKKQNCNQQTSLIQAILESLFYCFQTQKPCSVRDVSKTGFIMIKK